MQKPTSEKTSILLGFLKLSKPEIILNPGVLESLAGLQAAIAIVLSSSKHSLKEKITRKKITILYKEKSLSILPFDDDETALVFGVSPYVELDLAGYVWANSVWHHKNLFVLKEHKGHEAISQLLLSAFKLCKINDPDYQSAKYSTHGNDQNKFPDYHESDLINQEK